MLERSRFHAFSRKTKSLTVKLRTLYTTPTTFSERNPEELILMMKNFGRFLYRTILCSSGNGGLLLKPDNSQNVGRGFYVYRQLFFFSSSTAKTSDFSGPTSLRASLGTSHCQRDYFRGAIFVYFSLPVSSVSRKLISLGEFGMSLSFSIPDFRVKLWTGQRRSMFIQTQSTPNPASLMFYPGKPLMDTGSADFPNARTAMSSPLAKNLFGIDGITRVFFGTDFVTVTKSEDSSWDFLKPEIFAAIMDFYSSEQPLFLDSNTVASMDTAIHEDDSETVAMIKELLETRIRPAVQDDGGDIEFVRFDPDTGIIKLRMQGACSGCPSSSVTLKSGIENMLMHYVPEVKGVEQELDAEDGDAALTGAPYE
ncbi:UNVERIFIED_CONTAM: NifU-like protein 4, mitochondrial [Sesamum calycinum]|uniref:NifU-like protein 4, mitochondrial n=2 Tax=Sesamum TaxID=4181 RepID=A0AAW2RRI2_9LAMI